LSRHITLACNSPLSRWSCCWLVRLLSASVESTYPEMQHFYTQACAAIRLLCCCALVSSSAWARNSMLTLLIARHEHRSPPRAPPTKENDYATRPDVWVARLSPEHGVRALFVRILHYIASNQV
jgi:hypothetical protein